MKKLLYLILFLTIIQIKAFAQENLVLNGNFENYTKLPVSLFLSDYIGHYITDWGTPNLTTPDYYNRFQNIPQVKIPLIIYPPGFPSRQGNDSIRKIIYPVSGDAFAAIGNGYNIESNGNPYYICEYLEGKIKTPLIKNIKYKASFFYNNFGYQSLIIDALGIMVTDSINLKTYIQPNRFPSYFYNNDAIINRGNIMDKTDQWIEISGYIKSKGYENKVIIGYFKQQNSIEILDSNNAYINYPLNIFSFQNYFYIDSVTLYEIPCLVAQDTACAGDSVSFYHTFSGPAIWARNSDSTQHVLSMDSVYTFIANQSGWYYVFTPFGKDSSYLTVIDKPSIELVQDTFFCEESSVILNPTITNATYFIWSDGSSNSSLTVNRPGNYRVLATNSGCSTADSIIVTEHPKPNLLSQHQFSICSSTGQYQTFNLNPSYQYTWQTLKDTLNTVTFTHAGCETVIIQSVYSCNIEDEVCVTDLCAAKVFVPNAFVPSGINNTFKPVVNYVQSIHWEVYNKWGERVFETDDPNDSWDGTFKGKPCSGDVYFYKVNYTGLIDSEMKTLSGAVTLLR